MGIADNLKLLGKAINAADTVKATQLIIELQTDQLATLEEVRDLTEEVR